MGESILGTLRRQFEDDIERMKDNMTTGGAKDWAEYRQQVGTIRGIDRCLERVKSLEKTLMEGDYDD